jgi:hypothetical protein
VLVISTEYYDSNKLFFYKHFAHNLPIFLIGKIWLNIGICQTLGFSILKISPQFVCVRSSLLLTSRTIFVLCPTESYLTRPIEGMVGEGRGWGVIVVKIKNRMNYVYTLYRARWVLKETELTQRIYKLTDQLYSSLI